MDQQAKSGTSAGNLHVLKSVLPGSVLQTPPPCDRFRGLCRLFRILSAIAEPIRRAVQNDTIGRYLRQCLQSIDTRRSRRYRVFRPGVSGNFVHSVVPIRLSHSMRRRETTEWGQPNSGPREQRQNAARKRSMSAGVVYR